MRAAGRRSAAGLGLVDVCAAVATVGVLTAVVAAAVPTWTGGAHQRAEVQSVQGLLREAQHEALAEGRPRCVESRTWTILHGPCGADRAGVTFFADGSATPGTFRVGSDTVTVNSSGWTAVSPPIPR